MMKKLFLLLLPVLLLWSCSLDDEDSDTSFKTELVPIVSASIPDTLTFGKSYTFDIVYEKPSTCHSYRGLYYEREFHIRYVGVISAVYESSSCKPLENVTDTVELKFIPKRSDYYTFKLWKGLDEENKPEYITIKVPVKKK